MSGARARDDQDPDQDRRRHDRRTEVGLQEDERRRDRREHRRAEDVLQVELRTTQLGEERGEHGDHRQLRELRRGKLEPEQLEPPLRALDGGPERRPDQDQQDQARDVEQPRVDLGEPVVEARGHDRDERGQRQEPHLLLHVEAVVELLHLERLVRRRIDQRDPDRRQQQRRRDEHRVDVADRPAIDGGVRPARDEVHQSVTAPRMNPDGSSP
jgi:hypothetical protein